jgi:hypothetical protein
LIAEVVWKTRYRASLVLAALTVWALWAASDRGLDITDESQYLYDLQNPGPNSGTHINFVAGKIGYLFANNIVVWRTISLALLVFGAVVFARGIWRLGARLGLARGGRSERSDQALGLGVAVTIGTLGYYGYGPASFSSNTIGAFGVLAAFGSLAHAVVSTDTRVQQAWTAFASLCAVLMEAGRISAAAPYLLAGLPLMWMSAQVSSWRTVAIIVVSHIGYGLLWLVIFVLGFRMLDEVIAVTNLMLSTAVSSKSSYNLSALAVQHGQDLALFGYEALRLGGYVLVLGAVAGLVLHYGGQLVGRSPSTWKNDLVVGVAFFMAALPLLALWEYIADLDRLVRYAVSGCNDATVIFCQGPTPALGGRPFTFIVGGQIVAASVLVGWDWRLAPSKRDGIVMRWVMLLAFSLLTTTVTSVGTNTGFLYHMMLCMGPLFAASFLATAMMPLRSIAPPPPQLAALGVACFALLTVANIAHNRIFFLHRIDGTVFQQEIRLEQPPELRGLKVSKRLADIMAGVNAALAKVGFDQRRDVVVAPYNIPGLIVAAQARALGFAWLNSGPGWDELNCYRIERDPFDIHTIGRVILIFDLPPGPELKACLKARGINFDQREPVAEIPVDALRTVSVAIVPVSR